MHRWIAAGLCAVTLGTAADASAQAAVPLRTRNLSPPVAIFALPSWQPRAAGTQIGATLELANHYRLSRRREDYLLLDGETLRLDLFAERRIGANWSVGLDVPLLRQYGGVLDDAIDAWHSIFGLPDGGRNGRPENAIDFQVGRGADAMIDVTGSESGLGDALVTVARSIGANGAYTLRLGAKLATGDERILAGSGATDWMVTILRTSVFALPRREAGLYWGAGLVLPGTPDRVRLSEEEFVITGLLGGGFSVRQRLGFRAQLEVHSPFFDSPLEELGQTAVQVSMGGWWSFGERSRLDFAISEDLHVSTAPDVVLHAGVQWRW